MKLLKAQTIFSETGDFRPLVKANRLHIFNARSHSNSMVILNFIIFSSLCIESLVDIADSFKIRHSLYSYQLQPATFRSPTHADFDFSFVVAGMKTVMKRAKPGRGLMISHQSYFARILQIFLCSFCICSYSPSFAPILRHGGRQAVMFHTTKRFHA